ncbi:hypothetical protein [Treponema sp. C6A8]|uniref:hypothetical protein n=1 Tax=Treponema sp. C6A8 TaxID=1410609 RepID=UPI0004825698|nr:hypothetical protein [Treponema sp. C6A8]
MNVNYVKLVMGVITDFRVIITIIAALFIVEFAKFVTSYKKKPARPKKEKAPKAPPPPPKPEAPAEGEGEAAPEE